MRRAVSVLFGEIVRLIIGVFLFALAIAFDIAELSIVGLVLYIASVIVAGFTVYYDAVSGILRGDLFDEKFLMSIASIGAFVIGESREGAAVMLFYLLGEIFMHRAVRKSRSRIRALISICPDEATVVRDGIETIVDADEVEVGDVIVVRAGERLSADGVVIEGSSDVDTSSLTGEAMPRSVGRGDVLDSGVIVLNGVLTLKVLRTPADSGASRIINMVEEATERKSREENFITSFSRVYTPIVVAIAALIAVILPLMGVCEWVDSLERALVFLVVSCPCALVISVPMAFFSGIGASASRGILFKGGNSFAPIAAAKTVAYDKTGTLTKGEFEIGGTLCARIPEDELLSLMASVEQGSNHPIAEGFRKRYSDASMAKDVTELAGMGAIGTVAGEKIAVGNKKLMKKVGAVIPPELEESRENLVFAAKNGDFIGAVIISDAVKFEAAAAIDELKRLGIERQLILSGDRKERAELVAKEVGISEIHAELMPDDKYRILGEIIESSRGKTMYVGDGINDAPSLMLSDVGVAMGGTSADSAIESADLVIVSNDLSRIPEAVKIARKTLAIAKQNIVFAIGIKIIILALGALGMANMWLAVFADVGVAVLAILNSMRALIAPQGLKEK